MRGIGVQGWDGRGVCGGRGALAFSVILVTLTFVGYKKIADVSLYIGAWYSLVYYVQQLWFG